MNPKKRALSLLKKFQSDNPYDLCASLNLTVLPVPLCDLRGFLVQLRRNNIVFVAENLNEFDSRFVLFHEIGHFVMHREVNRMFLDSRTFLKTSPYEREANQFATCCLYPDDADLYSYIDRDIQTTSRCLGLPVELAQYRMELIDYPFNLTF